jgi:uncharacterized protein (DUF1800 family)
MRFLALPLLTALLLGQTALAQSPSPTLGQSSSPKPARAGRVATPTMVSPGPVAAPAPAPGVSKVADYDRQRLLAGHLLRRIGFGPNPAELKRVLQIGTTAYVDEQLDPTKIDDSAAEKKFAPATRSLFDDGKYIRRWYTRMVYSRRQLQEKMTLVWHEHFAVSNAKVGLAHFMGDYEETLRKNCLGSFRTLLVEMTRDKAMLYWLDNNYNSGTDTDDEGNPIPPNENYGRELMQIFSLGTQKLAMDGTPVLGGDGQPLPNYSEDDVKAVARALTGWYAEYRDRGSSRFAADIHDSSDKTILGETLRGRSGDDGRHEVEDVVDIIMRNPSVAPFISRELIQKLATETPSPGYVERVAAVFKSTNGDIKATVRAILLDAEFTSDAVVRTQFKEPIEQFVGPLRALSGKTRGQALVDWTLPAKQLVYYPPSVFSFYRPGAKGALVNTAQATIRDTIADQLVSGYYDGTGFDAVKLIRKNHLTTPEQAVDFLSDALLTGPLDAPVRDRIVAYMDGRVDEEKFRGAAWLILCSPDFQRN